MKQFFSYIFIKTFVGMIGRMLVGFGGFGQEQLSG